MGSRLIAGFLAAIAAAGVVAGALMETGLPAPFLQWAFIVLALLFPALGWLLAVRRPLIPYGWLLLATAVSFGAGTLGVGFETRFAPVAGFVNPVGAAMYAVYYGLNSIFVPLLFPEGRLPSRRWRPVAWIGAAAIAAHAGGIIMMGPISLGNPTTAPLPAAVMASLGQLTAWAVAVIVAVGLVVRWRRSGRAERGQYAWMVAGATANLAGFVALAVFLVGGHEGWGMAGLTGILGSLPAAVAVAVVRHQLLDIRIGIRGSRLLMVFDVRPTVGEVLSRFGSVLDDSPEPVELLGRLAAAVRVALNTTWAAVRLADGARVVAGHEDGPAALVVPVRGGLGQLECGPREYGALTAEDRRFLEALAVPAGLAIQSDGLAARLVNAQEAERRRIERNIHDGVQQQLVALIAGLELARATGGGPRMLAELREQARQTLADLRELAAGIHPSALGQGGLVEAVEERCARLPVPTKVSVGEGLRAARFPDEVEGAMYFTVSEAVANALKHAAATRIEVRLAREGGRLRATVSDDGKGFDLATTVRRGLSPLSDRLDALGGRLEIVSETGKGTRMMAWVPVDG
ncbi:GAF domain-containing sensor histidine kinase [Nonomuraea sp. NPDC049152]|uniref:sensor histidine kinase n=1 Tax=Nonomuraea sp. NPDC049152 TaxID=3154350 RepID=UPI0033C8609B